MRARYCYPLISFLHVPGKMSQPLWLMMGTAFHIVPPLPCGTSILQHSDEFSEKAHITNANSCSSGVADLQAGFIAKIQSRHFFLTTKHTFVPWHHTKDASTIKIPADFRKQRYVIGRIYQSILDPHRKGKTSEKTQLNPHWKNSTSSSCLDSENSSPVGCVRASREAYLEVSLVATHPSLDVALLSVPVSATFSASSVCTEVDREVPPFSSPVALDEKAGTATEALALTDSGDRYFFAGYRGEGQLGEIDTFDASLLTKLPAGERTSLLNDLKDVVGKQTASYCGVNILSPLGAATAINGGRCYHGMSGSPLMDRKKNQCIGILYGKHTQYPQHIGYLPVQDFYPWVQKVITHLT